MKRTFRACALILVLVIVSCFAACGEKSQEDMIIGQWYYDSEQGSHQLKELEFFEDGTYTSNVSDYEGRYSISGNRLKLEGAWVNSITENFEVDGDKLTFYSNGGNIECVYYRQ